MHVLRSQPTFWAFLNWLAAGMDRLPETASHLCMCVFMPAQHFGDVLGREAIALHLLLDVVLLASGGAAAAAAAAASGVTLRDRGGGGDRNRDRERAEGRGEFAGGSVGSVGSMASSNGSSIGLERPPGLWLRLDRAVPPRTFMLELLEGVLLHRWVRVFV